MARAFIFVLDSFGIGGAADAADFGDEGVGYVRPYRRRLRAPEAAIATACAAARSTLPEHDVARPWPCRGDSPAMPMRRSRPLDRSPASSAPREEVSSGKDTPSGHWEIAAVPVPFEWGYFPRDGSDLSGRR